MKLGKFLASILLTPLPPGLSVAAIFIEGNVLSNDVISHN